ncbi:glycosyltransferase family 4 protein [Bordetella genomosp. 13]|uniref:glycosyltransferase family 4 protein n=1 Tax=Bordetella genomosp. 13 TaxID=463040 RepID=UPI0011A96AD1|nr:glycosyltransferase family 4 protein [Bordetella genomosp. 13]
MRIMLLVSSMHAGGAERVAATLVNAWAARGDTAILVPTYSSKGTCFYPLSDDVQLHWLADRAGTRDGGPLAAVRRLAALRGMIREFAPDVVVSFLTNVNIAAILATRGQDVPVIVCERTNPVVAAAAGPGLSALRRMLYPRADMVTVQAQSTVEPFARLVPGIRRLSVIPNPLPSDLAAAPLVPVDQAAGRKRLAGMGRMVPEKQFDQLIAAFAELAPTHPDWDLWLWGDGPQREALQAQVRAAGLQDRVFMPGRTETPWEELGLAHAFVMSSSVEGFPNVLLEAMALGMPCVTYDCPSGPREISRDGQDALLVPLGDRAGLRDAVRSLMNDPALRVELGTRAAQSVRGRYALPAVLAQWDRLFADVRKPSVNEGGARRQEGRL